MKTKLATARRDVRRLERENASLKGLVEIQDDRQRARLAALERKLAWFEGGEFPSRLETLRLLISKHDLSMRALDAKVDRLLRKMSPPEESK